MPWLIGSSLPMIGAVLGEHLDGRGTVCGDPASWFAVRRITNGSAFVLGRPGYGKSTLVRHMVVQWPEKGFIPLVLSDWKPDYADLIKLMDGQVLSPGTFGERINPCDLGPMWRELYRLPADKRVAAISEMRTRRDNVMEGLCSLVLDRRLEGYERTVLRTAFKVWESRTEDTPLPQDILAVIQERPTELSVVVKDRGEESRYLDRTEGITDALLGFETSFDGVFSGHTTTELEMYRPAVFDLSGSAGGSAVLQAGLQLVCWSYGSSAVAGAKFLADAGVEERRVYVMVMDELWRTLRAAAFMVDRVDDVVRLNRTLGLAQVLITHTMNDLVLDGLDGQATKKAWGFVSKSEMVFLGGLAPDEMGNLKTAMALSQKEFNDLVDWSAPGATRPDGTQELPPYLGCFLLKKGPSAGVPFRVKLTPLEKDPSDTSKAWGDAMASMQRMGASSGETRHVDDEVQEVQ